MSQPAIPLRRVTWICQDCGRPVETLRFRANRAPLRPKVDALRKHTINTGCLGRQLEAVIGE